MEHTGWQRRRSSDQVKRKDSCDTCSSAKVRCTKEKPSCARCCKYGHMCYYSPARRIGRPYRPRPSSPTPPVGSPSSVNVPAAASVAAAVSTGYDVSSAYAKMTDIQGPAVPSSGVYTIIEQSATPPPDAPEHPSSSRTSSATSMCCSTLVLDILQSLSASLQQDPIEPSFQSTTSSLLAAAVKSLSHILICPCSQQFSIALMCASVCLAMLDVVHVVICSSPSETSSYNGGSGAGGDSCDIRDTMALGSSMAQPRRDLQQVANLIVQFISRYDDLGPDDELHDSMPELVVALKGKLLDVMNKATSDRDCAK